MAQLELNVVNLYLRVPGNEEPVNVSLEAFVHDPERARLVLEIDGTAFRFPGKAHPGRYPELLKDCTYEHLYDWLELTFKSNGFDPSLDLDLSDSLGTLAKIAKGKYGFKSCL